MVLETKLILNYFKRLPFGISVLLLTEEWLFDLHCLRLLGFDLLALVKEFFISFLLLIGLVFLIILEVFKECWVLDCEVDVLLVYVVKKLTFLSFLHIKLKCDHY